ncbi:MAG: hypothetical protein A4E37_00219 [Methanoregulaceae archaeon PtaB.Bin056]|jgi:hypothetical protein|nr:MAG: hypothetical protein A4E37_00219 [Methanoregulaceae archaeon PtaB.Bin056]
MVLEETLLFNSADDADTFIRFLRKKRCKAHKKATAVFLDAQHIHGPIDRVIGYLKWLADVAEIEGDDIEDEYPLNDHIESLERRKEILGKFLSSHDEGDVVFSSDEIMKHSKTATLHMLYAMYPVFKEKMAGLGQELPPQERGREISEEEVREARDFLAVFDLLEENDMIEKEEEQYRLVKKLAIAECMMKENLAGLPEIDPDDLPAHGLSSHVNLSARVQYQVFMDANIHFQFSVDDIEEGLIGLDVDTGSLDEFYWGLERKQIAIRAILEMVDQAGRISFEQLLERFLSYPIHLEESTETVTLTLGREFLSSLVAEMRKEGYLSGSQENIRLGK